MKQLNYTDASTGANYPDSVWLPLGLGLDHTALNASITFLGYASLTALGTGKQPIGSHKYQVSGAAYEAMASGVVNGANLLEVISNACYGAIDDEFFDEATDI